VFGELGEGDEVAGTVAVVAILVAVVGPVGTPAAPLRLALRTLQGTAVELVLENSSDKPLEVPKAVAFHLDKGMYWAPAYMTAAASPGVIQVSVARPGAADAKQSPVKLAPRESRKVVIQLTELKWDKTIGGSWPTQTLTAAVPSGQHSVVVEVAFENASGPIRSNEVVIAVVKE
jgi:hypothetical protein